MRVLRLFVLALVTLNLHSAFALGTKHDQQVAMEAIIAELKTHYGMAKFKEKMFGVNLEQLRQKYAKLIDQAMTLEESLGWDPKANRDVLPADEFRQLMLGMIAELRDGHVNISRQNDEILTLGLSSVAVGERLIVSAVNKELMVSAASMNEIKPGDEILEVDGRSVLEHAKRNLLYMSAGTFADRFQDSMLFIVNNFQGYFRPKRVGDQATVKLRRGDKTFVAHLRWVSRSEFSFWQSRFPKHLGNPMNKANSEDRPVPYGARGTVRSYFKTGLLKTEDAGSLVNVGSLLNHDVGKTAEAVKTGATADIQGHLKELKPVTRLELYMVRHEGKNIGVLRIPSYSPGGIDSVKTEYKWLAEGLKKMEKLTDVLVIDQLSNTGGYVYYGARMLSLFVNGDQPMQTIMADYKLNGTMLKNMKPDNGKEPVDGTEPSFADTQLEMKYYKELTERYESGQEWSGLIPSFDRLSRNFENKAGEVFAAIEGVYSKPILLLNDKMSGSGGDFFPAQMQANGRAKIMGETSCGLGGPVYRNVDSMPGSEMTFRCTFAYAELPNGWPIENIGAVPDIYRPVVVSDLSDDFKGYATEVLNEAAKLAGWQPKSAAKPTKAVKEKDSVAGKIAGVVETMKELSPAAYLEKVRELSEVAKTAKPQDWAGVVIPLPETLKQDLILRTIYQRLEVHYRLMEMRELPEWRDSKDQLDVINALIDLSGQLPEDIRFAEPCEIRLTMTPLR